MNSRHWQLGRFGLRALRIATSTASIIELLRNDWTGGISAGVAWLVFVQVERRVSPQVDDPHPCAELPLLRHGLAVFERS